MHFNPRVRIPDLTCILLSLLVCLPVDRINPKSTSVRPSIPSLQISIPTFEFSMKRAMPASIRDQIRVIVMLSQALQRSGYEIRDLYEVVVTTDI